jgi:2-polyprenyl-3-methyl-5-hydroxy-6-metoxy-1,4-benzoquinol methylase
MGAAEMKVLAAIANYGTKNLGFLRTLIREYQSMPHQVDIVVLSNIPKELGPAVEVKVGLPTKDPWSLPFAHKRIFAERLKDYDLFIYSEDDMLIRWNNIETFIRLTAVLPRNLVSGFMRYEVDASGGKWYPDFVGPYHWLPRPVVTIGRFAFAEFSNVHSACYILTRNQLQRAIASGGYLVEPHQGRYDLLCSAATDPYTQCGLKKVICISHVNDVLIHHASNRYIGEMGIGEKDFEEQISFMLCEDYGREDRRELFRTAKEIDNILWDKPYYEKADDMLINRVPRNARNILSIGCGFPSTEAALVRPGRSVTAIPLDPIVGTLIASRGIEVTRSDFDGAFADLAGSSYDCILLSDVLQHLPDPVGILARAVKLLAADGELLISVPNCKYIKLFRDQFPYPVFKKWTYASHYLHMVDRKRLTAWLRSVGIQDIAHQYVVESPRLRKWKDSFGVLDPLFAGRLLVSGKRSAAGCRSGVKERRLIRLRSSNPEMQS